jgi:hypothetical protein
VGLSGGAAPFFNSPICVLSPKLSPNPPGEAKNGSDCMWVRLSQPTFRPTSKGSNTAVWVWSDCPTPVGSDCLNMKTFVGRIVTVSDGAGRSVTVSNWGGGAIVKAPAASLCDEINSKISAGSTGKILLISFGTHLQDLSNVTAQHSCSLKVS